MLKYLNKSIPLFLPKKDNTLTLTEVSHKYQRIRITGVEKRVAKERDTEQDFHKRDTNGRLTSFKAYAENITRGLVAFEWDLRTNVAMIQVSQLPSYWKYEDAKKRLQGAIGSLINFEDFTAVSLHRAIAKLHSWIPEQHYPLRYHGVEYQKGGRRLAGKSATIKDPLSGDPTIDSAMSKIRDEGGVATEGNFFFLGGARSSRKYKGKDVHVVIVAQRGRVNFPASNTEDGVRYAVQIIREASQ